MRDFLVDPKGAGLNPTDVLLLNGKDASNAAIRIGVSETLAGQSGSGLAYLYFAGHVVATSEGEAYLQAADTDLALLRTTGYPLRSLDQMLGATKGAVVLLMDLAGDSIDGQFSSLAAHGSVAAGLIAANSGFTAALSTKLAGLPATGPLTAGMLFEGLVLPSSVKRIGTNPSLVLASRPAPTPPSNPGGLTTISTTPAQQTPITGLLAEADGLRRAKKWQEAIAKYDEILAKAPDNSAAQGGRDEASRSQLAEASAQVADAKLRSTLNSAAADLTGGRYAEAELLYRDVLRQDGANRVAQDGLTEAILGQARALVKKESPDDALRLLAQLDTRNKQVSGLKVQALAVRAYLAGLSALGSRNWSEAIRDFGAANGYGLSAKLLVTAGLYDAFDQGAAAYAKGDLETALTKYLLVKSKLPGNPEGELIGIRNQIDSVLQQLQGEVAFRAGEKALQSANPEAARQKFYEALSFKHPKAQYELDQMPNADSLKRARQRFQDGVEAEAGYRWDKARDAYADALVIYPEYSAAKSALKRAEHILKIIGWMFGPSLLVGLAGIVYFRNRERRARVYFRLGLDRAASRNLERVLDERPTRLSALVALTTVYDRLGRTDLSLERCDRYLLLNRYDQKVWLLQGGIHFQRGQLEQALHDYEIALECGTELPPEVYGRMLEIHRKTGGNKPIKVEPYEKALFSEPSNHWLCLIVAEFYLRMQFRDGKALAIYRQALESEPENVAIRMQLAQAYLEASDTPTAIAELSQVLQRQPEHEPALSMLVKACRQSGSYDPVLQALATNHVRPLLALRIYEDVAQLDPNYRRKLSNPYRRVLESMPNGAKPMASAAARGTATVLAGDPASPERFLFEAHLAMDGDHPEAAAAALDMAYQSGPQVEEFRRELTRAYGRLVASSSERAVDPALLYRAGELRRAGGDWQGAISAMERLVHTPEWNQRAIGALGEILDVLLAEQISSRFFEEAGWRVDQLGSTADGAVDMRVYPPEATSEKLSRRFRASTVRCYNVGLSAGAIERFKQDLLRPDEPNRESAFVIAPDRPRPQVYAVIYTSATEEPSIRIVPLEVSSLKQAMIEANCGEVLEQAVRLWIGQSDLFDVHSPVQDASTFFGRQQFLTRLTNKILEGHNFGVFGLRKVGKTSLVYQLRDNLPGVLIAYVDLQAISSGRHDEIYFRMISALRLQMRIKHGLQTPNLKLLDFDAAGHYPNAATDFHDDLLALRDAIERTGRTARILLLMDEIEVMIPFGDNKGFTGHEEFFRQLRGLYQNERFILSGVIGADPTLCRIGRWGDRDNPIFQYYDELFLTFLDRRECCDMAEGIGRMMSITFESAALDLVFEQSGGHPYVARQLCSCITSRYRERPLHVDESAVRDGMQDYVVRRPDYFQGIFRSYAGETGRALLVHLAKSEDNELTRDRIISLMQGDVPADPAVIDQALQNLELFNLVARDRDVYRMKILLMRFWVRRSLLGMK